MTLYRADPGHGVAWVTGASHGIGRAVAKNLADAGYTVAVTALDEHPVDTLLVETAQMKGRVVAYPCDVSNEQRMADTVAAIERDLGPIALAIFNAGVYLSAPGENLQVATFRKSYEVNYFGVLNGMVPLVERMRLRGRGHVVLVGSVTAYFGWPTTAAYGGTKAALNILAESMRYDFDKMNIRIQIMNPGFVDTGLTASNTLPMPGLMPVNRAARRMLRGIKSGGFEVTFPHRLTWGLKLLSILPRPFRHWFIETVTRWRGRPLNFDRRPPKD